MGKEHQATPKHEVQPLVLGDKVDVVPAATKAGKEKDDLGAPAKKFSPFVRQAFVAAGPVMATVSSGMTTGYSAVLLPQLLHPNSTIPITSNQASWIASMAPLPMALGCLLAGLLLDRLGRRRSQLVICVPFTVGWVLLAVANDLPAILGGRFLTGLCVGLVGPPSMIYIGETASPAHRGLLLAAISLAVAVGILVAHVLGSLLHWRLTAWLCATAPIACVALLCPSPESPVWLAAKGNLAEATRAFRWLRGFDDAATLELHGLLSKHAVDQPTHPTAAAKAPTLPLWRQLLQRSFIKPFLIITIFFFIMQFSGVNAVAFYTVSIMKDVGGGLDEYVATIILDVVRVLMSCVACVLLRRTGRRPLAVLSAAVTGMSLLGLGAVLGFGDPARYPWLPTSLLVLYITAVSLGLVPLPWVMAGEVFPANLRGLGGGATSAFAFIYFFSVVKTGPELFAALTPAGAFAAYGAVALGGSIFLLAFLPETKNRTLQEIEEEMAGRHPGRLLRRKAELAEP
ncbi:facilitated trehalose transporter Tret1-2 homolog isoform X3 [Thrips palmi]|nr:facilitated trehalose transporter Tret1-2 homolog isoform X3 [Thrips palmi]